MGAWTSNSVYVRSVSTLSRFDLSEFQPQSREPVDVRKLGIKKRRVGLFLVARLDIKC